MGYFNSYGQWVNTGSQAQGQNFGNSYPPQQTNGAWGGGQIFQNQLSIVPVNGRATAEDYPVAPGAKVMLIDQNELVAYVKERDLQGRSLPFLIYDLVIRDEPKPEPVTAQPVIDYDKIRSMISEEVSNALKKTNNRKEAR